VIIYLALIGLTLVTPDARAQSPAAPTTAASSPAPADTSPLALYRDRLTALDPSQPLAYFELAEEIAAEVRTPEGRRLARHLYVLAILAPRPTIPATPAAPTPSAPAWLSSSAALGLAALAENEHDRRWLSALAGTLAPVDTAVEHQPPPDTATRDAAAVELATALGLIRAGDGRKAAKILDKPAVATLLGRYEGLLNSGGLGGGGDRIRSLAAKYPTCPECRNRRYIKNADGIKLCPTCQGRPGPKLSIEELLGQLRLESLLLNGIQRSWAAQTVADSGAPMRELDAAVLADVYAVDPTHAYWRAGIWIADPSAPLAPSTPPTPPLRPSGESTPATPPATPASSSQRPPA
jgi:hypothetical protein